MHKRLTNPVNKPQYAGAAKILNAAELTLVPTPMSPCVIKVPTILMNSSGDEVPTAMIVAPATSGLMCSAVQTILAVLLCGTYKVSILTDLLQ